MGQVTLRDESGRVLIQEYFGASAGRSVEGVFENDGDVNNSEVNEGLDILREAVNSQRYSCASDFHWSWDNFGRDSFACVQPNRLPQGGSVTEQYGVREVRHVQLEYTEEGSRRVGPLGILRETYTTDPLRIPVTVRWDAQGRISIFREDLPNYPPPAITPPAPPPPPQPDPIAEAYDSVAKGVGNFFSDAATRISRGADSAIQSLRNLIG